MNDDRTRPPAGPRQGRMPPWLRNVSDLIFSASAIVIGLVALIPLALAGFLVWYAWR